MADLKSMRGKNTGNCCRWEVNLYQVGQFGNMLRTAKESLAFSASALFFHIGFGTFLYLLIAKAFYKRKRHAVPVKLINISETADRRVGDRVISGTLENVVKADPSFHL